jgi:hypothetical protein
MSFLLSMVACCACTRTSASEDKKLRPIKGPQNPSYSDDEDEDPTRSSMLVTSQAFNQGVEEQLNHKQ